MRSAALGAVRAPLLALACLHAQLRGSLASRHLILSGCSQQNPDLFWMGVRDALVDGLANAELPFDSISCPMNKLEERTSVEDLVAREAAGATLSDPMVIVAALVQPWNCAVGGGPATACTSEADDFSTYSASMTLRAPVVHWWIEVAPNLTKYGWDNATSLKVIPDNFDGGRKAGIEFCVRTQGSQPMKMAALLGAASAAHSFARINGFESAVRERCPQHSIVFRAHADWSREKAKQLMSAVFLSDSSITGAVCANDGMALGVIDAAKDALPNGLAGLLVAGYDNVPEIQEHRQAGTVAVTVDQLATLPKNGLVYTLSSAIKHIDKWSKRRSGGNLNTAAVTNELRLQEPALQSSVMPVVTNMKGWLLRGLMNTYDKQVRPFSHLILSNGSAGRQISAPTRVAAQLHLIELSDINEVDGTFSIEGYLRLWWTDARLAYEGLAPGLGITTLPLVSTQVWLPDLYFSGSVSQGDIFAPGHPQPAASQMEVYPSGEIFWSRHMQLTLKCDMDFTWLPWDKQVCPFTIGTYSQDSTMVTMGWHEGEEAVSAWQGAAAPPWTLMDVRAASTDKNFQSGTWSYATVNFHMKRDPSSRQTDLELAGICVGLVCLSFWVRWDPTALHIVLMLILVTQREMVQSQLPPSARTGGWLLDWLNGAFFFVVGAMIIEAGSVAVERLGGGGRKSRAVVAMQTVFDLAPKLMGVMYPFGFAIFALYMHIKVPDQESGVATAWVGIALCSLGIMISAGVAGFAAAKDWATTSRAPSADPEEPWEPKQECEEVTL